MDFKKEDEDNYTLEYDKKVPLTTKEKMAVLEKLNATFGFSLKAVIDNVEGVDFDQYIEDSIYEQNVLKLQEKSNHIQILIPKTEIVMLAILELMK